MKESKTKSTGGQKNMITENYKDIMITYLEE